MTFEQGILWAAAWLAEAHDQLTMAAEMVCEAGVDLDQADIYDKPFIEKIRAELAEATGGER